MKIIGKPFGQADCESELEELKANYSELYFDETPFNISAIKPETYLIIGRRGAGKTALAQYFSFQRLLPNPLYIDVDEPDVYQKVLADMAAHASESRLDAIPRLKKLWEYILWCLMFQHTREQSTAIAEACDTHCNPGRPSHLINYLIDKLLALLQGTGDKALDGRIEQLLTDEQMTKAKAAVLKIAAKRPIIIAFDTLEQYDTSNNALMNAMAALVQCAARFNLTLKDEGIHLKVFMSGEVFPYLKAEVLLNPLKSVKDPVYLFWRPKDLLRLISWRFYRYLLEHNLLLDESKGSINWTNHREVFDKMWVPYFGLELTNSRKLKEHTFAYVLRHTQMRPRQLILLCNAIAERASQGGRFPKFSEADLRQGIKDMETDLAIEIINSFSSLYPNVSKIVDALMRIPMLFKGNILDKRAHQSASEWPHGGYSQAQFRRLVTELGIVGRVRRHDEEAGYIDADFEYSLREPLPITPYDVCVVHPMFYSRFNVDFNSPSRVIPVFSIEQEEHNKNDYLF